MTDKVPSPPINEEARMTLLLQAVIDYAIFMLDANGVITSWNTGAERLKGYTTKEIVGQHFSIFYSDADRANGLPIRALGIATSTGKYEAEGWRVRKNGTRFWASVVIDRILDEHGTLVGFAKITRDITDKHDLEIAKEQLYRAQKMETIGQLTGGVAHDFNNLLTAVIGSLSLAIALSSDIRTKRLMETANRAAERGAKLITQLLAFSRRQMLETEPSNLNELISMFDMLLRRAVGESVAIETRLEPQLWTVDVDQAQFQSAVLNLAVNSRDALPKGGVLVIETSNVDLDANAATAVELAPGKYVVVSVIDTGTGMTAEVQAKAFEPFFTTKDVGKGSGLGLSQVYGFARQSGGQLTITTAVGLGTTMRLFLPLSISQITHIDPLEPSILIVEDDPDVLEVGVETLKTLGYRVFSAANGLDALTLLRLNPNIVVLFTDVIMPRGMDGIELAREARLVRPDLHILLASGYTRDGLRSGKGLLITDVGFIAKPYDILTLGEKLSQFQLTLPSDSVAPLTAR